MLLLAKVIGDAPIDCSVNGNEQFLAGMAITGNVLTNSSTVLY